MFKLFAIVVLMTIACASAKPKPLVHSVAYTAAAPAVVSLVSPVAAGVVTARSSQYVARNYNGFAAAYTAPLAAYSSLPLTSAAYVSPYYAAPAAYVL